MVSDPFPNSWIASFVDKYSSFTLESGKMYNYTIRTGSYSQIIHEREFNARGGKITCSEFIDVNGKSYNDWIPAISLENKKRKVISGLTYTGSSIAKEEMNIRASYQSIYWKD